MGLARTAIKLIAETVRDHKIGGRALLIGKQDVWGSESEIVRWLGDCGMTPAPCEVRISLKPEFRRLNFIQDVSLFELMGFKRVVTLDNSDYEGAEILCDLNRPVSDGFLEKTGRFDLVIESGCLEHIFNVPQVLKNLFHLTADRGVAVHIAPSSNYVDHGFYMFSPTLFQDYYSANRWRILHHYFFQTYPDYNARTKIYKYNPGALAAFAFSGGLNRAMCNIYVAAQKELGATCDAEVQQGLFAAAWAARMSGETAVAKRGWPALRERLKPHVPRWLIPTLMGLETRIKTAGGIARYLEFYKKL